MNPNQQVPSTIPSQAEIQAALARANIPPAAVNTAVTSQWANVDAIANKGPSLLQKAGNAVVGEGKKVIDNVEQGIEHPETLLTRLSNDTPGASDLEPVKQPDGTMAINKAGADDFMQKTMGFAGADDIGDVVPPAKAIVPAAEEAAPAAEEVPPTETAPSAKNGGKAGMQNPKQYVTPASTQAQAAAATLPKEQLGTDINTMETTAKNRLLDNNNPTPSKVMGHDLASTAIDSDNPTSIKTQMNTVGATKDATIESIKDKPVAPEPLKDISSGINEDTEDIDSSDKGNKRLENFKNELHMLASGQKEASVGGTKIYVPGGKDYVPTVGDVDAFIDKWQKKPKFSDSDAQKAINTALGKVNDHLKSVTDVHDNGIYRKANEDFFKLYDARDKARGILGSIDPNTNQYAGASSFNKSFSSPDQPLAGLQKVTGHNMAARAAIADAFDSTVGASDKTNALKNIHASISPTMMGVRSGLSIVMKDLQSPEALASKLRAIAKIK